MKSKNLWIPCSFENRRPLLVDRLMYIPSYYEKHKDFSFLAWEEIFQNSNPVHVEYCSGNGQWISQKAQEYPEINWVAVEKRFKRAKKIWAKIQRDNIGNLLVVFGDAKIFTENYLFDHSVEKAFMNFPDPWPKQKHAKHRLVQKNFITNLSKVLKREEKIIIVTDDETYREQIISAFHELKKWISTFDPPYYVNNWPNYGESFFEHLWKSQGKEIFYLQFQNGRV